MNRYLTKVEVEKRFKRDIFPSLNKSDKPEIRLAWHIYIDMLCKDGEISQNQYENGVYRVL